MISNLIRRLCCGATSETGNSDNVVAGPASDAQEASKQSKSSNGNEHVLQADGFSCLSRPTDPAVHQLVTTSQTAGTTEAEHILRQELSSFITSNETSKLSTFYDYRQKDNLAPSVSTLEARGQAPSPVTDELADMDPSLRIEELSRSQGPSPAYCNEPNSPFESTSNPATPLDGPRLLGGNLLKRPGPTVALPTLLCGAASGMDLPPRHIASIASTEMQLTTSLSEPLVHSSSPGSATPEPQTCSSSIETAVTATSGGSGAAVAPLQHPVWSAVATGFTRSAHTASSTTTTSTSTGSTSMSVAAAPVAAGLPVKHGRRISAERLATRESRSIRGSVAVERSGGSRLGRPELAVLGAAASAMAAPTAAEDAAVVVNEPVAIGGGDAGTSATGFSSGVVCGNDGVLANMDAGVDTPTGSQTSAGTAAASGSDGGSAGGGFRGGGAFGMLGGMTRRLLHMVHDVSSAVTQAALLSAAVTTRADSAGVVATAAPDSAASGPGGGSMCLTDYCSAVTEVGEEDVAAPVQQTMAAPLPPPPPSLLQVPPLPGSPHGQADDGHQGQQQPQQQEHQRNASNGQWTQPRTGHGQAAAAATVITAAVAATRAVGPAMPAAAPPAAAVCSGLYGPYVAGKGSLCAGIDSSCAVSRRGLDDIGIVQLPGPHPHHPSYPSGTGAWANRLIKHMSRDVSQVAMMQMLHFGSTSGRVPLQHLASLNVTNLSREIRALHWIGQGGGGAVFQGVWQGAPVAVKFMLAARPEHVDATALEAIVSSAVGHPNVVTTYSFDVTRLTETSLMPEAASAMVQYRLSQQPTTLVEDSSATALFNALMETETVIMEPWGHAGGGGGGGAHRHRQHGTAAVGGGGGGGSGGSGSRPASVHRMESLSVRLRRAQAAAAVAGNSSNTPDGSNGSLGNDHDRADAAGGAGAGWQSDATRDPSARPSQRQQAAPQSTAVDSLGIESAFNSEEGFGDPDLTDNSHSWTVRHVLAYLKARPGMYMTHIIMEYCDRGSLMSAIKRGIFRMDALPDDDGAVGSSGAAAFSGADGGAASTSATAAAAAAAAAVGLPDPARFTRRVVLRALIRTARDVAQGMCHLHANGIIHGDLKPGNVLLRGCRSDRRGFVAVVSDFGLSKITRGDKPLELNHWSTVTVMAPEVIMGRWLKASDVFSFGILLWQLVTGEMMPYGNATVQQVLMGVAHGLLKPEWPASAHPPLVRLGRACLATSPEKRPSFEAIVKILIKMEQHVRNARRPPRDLDMSAEGGSGRSRSSGSENAAHYLNRLRSSGM